MKSAETSEIETKAPPAAASTRTLFRVPFRSEMNDHDLGLLRMFGIAHNLHPKHPAVSPVPGAIQLGSEAALYFVHGPSEGEWALECRSWGNPRPEAVRYWRIEAVFIARQLDPSATASGSAGRSDG